MTLSVGSSERALSSRQRWQSVFTDHIAHSKDSISSPIIDDDRDEILPLISIQDTFKTAQAHRQILEQQMSLTTQSITQSTEHANASNSIHALDVVQQFTQILDTSKEMMNSLSHCLTVFIQQDELRRRQLEDERDKSRVLQESLHALAREQLLIERSMTNNLDPSSPIGAMFHAPSLVSISDHDEFYDCDDEDDDSDAENDSNDDTTQSLPPCQSIIDDEGFAGESTEPNDGQCEDSVRKNNIDLGVSIYGGRCRLPAIMHSRSDFSVWSILKQCIGRELSKITMPVVFNEPLSFLQRMVEYLEYVSLLRKASESDDPIRRLELVTAFAVSALASNWERIGKPFNPLLGETYHLDREDLGFRIVCEQVSHHPPVSAFHAESPLFNFSGAIQPIIKFWGKSVEVTPKGVVTLHLLRHNEMYTWQNVNCYVHNIIIGKIWIEHSGTMEVTNHTTHYKSVLNFKSSGWFAKDLHKVEGFIYDDKKQKRRAMYGNWIEAMYSCDADVWENRVSLAQRDEASFTKSSEKEHPVELRKKIVDTQQQNVPVQIEKSVSHENDAVAENQKVGEEVAEISQQNVDVVSFPTDVSQQNLSNIADDSSIKESLREESETNIRTSSLSILKVDGITNNSMRNVAISCDLHLPGQTLLWVAASKPEDSYQFYNFTLFAMILNELDEGTKLFLPPTDCRFRPDMRHMENGDLDNAAYSKNILEEKQRAARKARNGDASWKPMWFQFKKLPSTGKDVWQFTNQYWKHEWSKCPDIF